MHCIISLFWFLYNHVLLTCTYIKLTLGIVKHSRIQSGLKVRILDHVLVVV